MEDFHVDQRRSLMGDRQVQEASVEDGVPGPRERCWRLFVWLAGMVLIGTAVSLLSTP